MAVSLGRVRLRGTLANMPILADAGTPEGHFLRHPSRGYEWGMAERWPEKWLHMAGTSPRPFRESPTEVWRPESPTLKSQSIFHELRYVEIGSAKKVR